MIDKDKKKNKPKVKRTSIAYNSDLKALPETETLILWIKLFAFNKTRL
jgi:hypothetical protein